jgi:hypothetical protein
MSLNRAIGSLSAKQFKLAVQYFRKNHKSLKDTNEELARQFLVAGKLQVAIAEENEVTPALVHKQCKRIYEAHQALTNPDSKKQASEASAGIR